MHKSKFTETQIVSILKQADAGLPVEDLCRQAVFSVATYSHWKSKFWLVPKVVKEECSHPFRTVCIVRCALSSLP